MSGASTEPRSGQPRWAHWVWEEPPTRPHERRVMVFNCEVLVLIHCHRPHLHRQPHLHRVYGRWWSSQNHHRFTELFAGRLCRSCRDCWVSAWCLVRQLVRVHASFWWCFGQIHTFSSRRWTRFLEVGSRPALRAVRLLHALVFSTLDKQTATGQFLGWNSDCDNVRADALWKALNMKARSPQKVMDVSDLVSMTLCPTAWRSSERHDCERANLDWSIVLQPFIQTLALRCTMSVHLNVTSLMSTDRIRSLWKLPVDVRRWSELREHSAACYWDSIHLPSRTDTDWLSFFFFTNSLNLDLLIDSAAAKKKKSACDRRQARSIAYILSHEWPPTTLSCGKHGSALPIGFLRRLRLCWESWKFKINLGENSVYLPESNVSSRKLDTQGANTSLPQFYRMGSSFFGCWFANGWNPSFRSLECGHRSIAFFKEHPSSSERSLSNREGRWSSAEKSSQPQHQINKNQSTRSWWNVSCRSRCHKRKTFSIRMYNFEDKEAVIKMIMKGRSLTMRHVSRTHRVALDWLLGGIKMDPKIQIKYVDSKNQLADSLTEGNLKRDEWSHLLRLFNIMNFSMFSSSHFLSIKKIEHHVGESWGKKDRRRACGGEIEASEFDIKKFERESISHVGFGCMIQPVNFRARWNSDLTSTEKSGRDREENSASSSPVWRRDDNLFQKYGKIGARDESAFKYWKTGAWSAESTYTEVKLNHHNLEISNTRYLEKVFANVGQKLNRPGDDQKVLDQKIKILIWRLFTSTTMKAHLEEHQLRGAQDVVRHHAETDLEPEARDQARYHDWMAIYFLDEIKFATWHSNQVVKKPRYTSIQTQFFVCERCTDIQMPW